MTSVCIHLYMPINTHVSGKTFALVPEEVPSHVPSHQWLSKENQCFSLGRRGYRWAPLCQSAFGYWNTWGKLLKRQIIQLAVSHNGSPAGTVQGLPKAYLQRPCGREVSWLARKGSLGGPDSGFYYKPLARTEDVPGELPPMSTHQTVPIALGPPARVP